LRENCTSRLIERTVGGLPRPTTFDSTLGGRESRLQGEGRQGIDVGWTIRHRSPWESLVSPEILAAVTKEEPMTALAESRQSLESPLQGNLHGGFGGGSGETQSGCAPCSYLTIRLDRMRRIQP
jgi:hypothetical protein